ncbi:MAG TPA: cation:proton antiporter [Alphaproteobacteria bacterium]|jgi:multicomponent Na+:H+ antiporter subunit B|nr:cation:proton antiporter [Alphaproteobacteria bacterium]
MADIRHHIILRECVRVLIPVILLFALYVQTHGDFSPGGGFQAGVIFASGLILYGLVFGQEALLEFAPLHILARVMALGWLLYVGVGFACLAMGGNYLEYYVLNADPLAGQHLGIFLIELGVGVTVAATMVVIFICFTARQLPAPADD